MSGHRFRLTPVDTWFFRDGRPFEMGPLQSDAESLLPPPARTLVEALRLALARGQGYLPGPKKWDSRIAEVLGDGPHALGKLRFSGPYLIQGDEVLYPFPAHIVGEWIKDENDKKFAPRSFLQPGQEVLTDLGTIRLPELKTKDVARQSGQGLFLRRSGYEQVLRGTLPDASEIVLPDALYAHEDRIGLERNEGTRIAETGAWGVRRQRRPEAPNVEPGHLYDTRHIRLLRDVGILMSVLGLPEGWTKACPRLITLGGENRLAELETMQNALSPLAAPVNEIQRSGNLTITLLTPLSLGGATMPRAGERFADWDGVTVVSACLDKPFVLGGRDGEKRESLPLQQYMPPGSTWFCKVDELAKDWLEQRSRGCVGAEGAWGFGAVALGTW
jgi:CRISPR-associated protein Cmr3